MSSLAVTGCWFAVSHCALNHSMTTSNSFLCHYVYIGSDCGYADRVWCKVPWSLLHDQHRSESVYLIGLYTPINYFGRYATLSHKDGGRSIFSVGKPLARRTTCYAYNYVGARKFKSCVFEPLTRRVFSINTSSSSTLFLFDQFSSQRQHSLWPNFSAAATPCLADIHIQGLWDAFLSLRNYLFLTIEKGHFKLAILFVA